MCYLYPWRLGFCVIQLCIIAWGMCNCTVCLSVWIVQSEFQFLHFPRVSTRPPLSSLCLALLVRWGGILLDVYTHSSNTIWVGAVKWSCCQNTCESLLYGLRHITDLFKGLSESWCFGLKQIFCLSSGIKEMSYLLLWLHGM